MRPYETMVDWLRQVQGLVIDAESLAMPAGMAERFGTVARDATARLPFGAEPSGYQRLFDSLAPGGGDDAR